MRRNCNLELRLVPISDNYDQKQNIRSSEESSESPLQQQQQLTIFYNGKVVVSDVTEMQARAIILLASREMEEKLKTPKKLVPTSPNTLASMCSPSAPGLSMKKSLQRFLQKRQNRIQATSPYYNH